MVGNATCSRNACGRRYSGSVAALYAQRFSSLVKLEHTVFALPYAYVGPWTPLTGEFWNAPFGAALTADRIGTADDAVAFCTKGRELTERSRS